MLIYGNNGLNLKAISQDEKEKNFESEISQVSMSSDTIGQNDLMCPILKKGNNLTQYLYEYLKQINYFLFKTISFVG